MKHKGPTQKTRDKFTAAFHRNKLRRKLRATAERLQITAPFGHGGRHRREREVIVPLGEAEFEEQMEIGWRRED